MPEIKVNIAKASDAKIRRDLRNQLKAKGADVLIFRDLIDRYIYFRRLEIEMQRDVSERGLSYLSVSSTGKEYVKDNPSIKNAIMYNKQCLEILKQLDLTTKTVDTDTADDDDL